MTSTDSVCWWCRAPADSREHKFKKSELVFNAGGARPWVGENEMEHGSDEGQRKVQGPDSTIVKFQPSMCQNCNNARSQPFDRAYDIFIHYMAANEATIGIDRKIRFSEIYGNDWATERVNLIKYWVKHVCCMAVEYGMPIPAAVVEYLDGDSSGPPPHTSLYMAIQLDVLRLRLNEGMDYGSFIGPVEGLKRGQDGPLYVATGHTMWGWVQVPWVFNLDVEAGSVTFDSDEFTLDWVSLITKEYTLDATDLMESDHLAHWREHKDD